MGRLLFLGTCALCLSTAFAADRYAAPEATGSGDDAYNPGDLEALVAAAGEGDVVHLAVGDYPLADVLTIDRGFSVVGAGMDKSVVIPAKSKRAFLLNHAGAELTGVTVRGGSAGAWNMTGSAILIDANGGAMSDVRVTDCVQTSNQGGGVLTVAGPGCVSRCIFDNKTISGSDGRSETSGGIVRLTGAATVDNCLIHDNTSNGDGGGIVVNAAATVRNCTIVNNHAVWNGGGLRVCNKDARVYNTVVAFNSSGNDSTAYAPNVTFVSGASAAILDHCAFSGTVCGSCAQEVTEADFPRAASGNYRPSAASACLDNGTLACWDDLAGVVDLAGARRLVGKSVDIGCCERPIAGTRMLVR